MFNMFEMKGIFNEVSAHQTNSTNGGDDVLKERITMMTFPRRLNSCGVLFSRSWKIELGAARTPVERICALLDMRREDCSAEHLTNGSESLTISTVNEEKNVGKTFVGPGVGQASSAAGGGGGGGPNLLGRRLLRTQKRGASSASSR